MISPSSLTRLEDNLADNRTDIRRGFTDHEHLDEAELIHMNGRVYDYNVGRFMSVDPIIHGNGNSQSINPYSYIMNNPMSGTDPTGYMSTTDGTAAESERKGLKVRVTESSIARESSELVQVGSTIVSGGSSVSFSGDSPSTRVETFAAISKGITAIGNGAVHKNSQKVSSDVNSMDLGGHSAELLIGGPYTKDNGDEVTYGHVALRVFGENEDGAYDYVYDFGRYGKKWGTGGSEGEGTLRVWTNFDDYIKGENVTGKTTTGYVFSLSSEQAGKINAHFSNLTSGLTPTKVRGSMQQFRIASNYHAANCNCTTVAMDGLKAGNPKLYNILNQNKFDQGRGLSWLNRKAYNYSKTGNGVRMPLDLQEAVKQYGKATAVNTYKW